MASQQATPGTPGPPTSISDQINRLSQRGMSIPNQDEAVRLLSSVSFYRFRGYLEPFVDHTTNREPRPFKAGTTLDAVTERYVFDTRLRVLMWEAFSHIEISIRTQWTYHLSYSQGGGQHSHLDPNLFVKNHSDNLVSLEKDYNERGQKFHQYDFSDCPTWAVSEVMSFGQLSRWYGDTIVSVRKRVAGHYQLHHKLLAHLLHHLTLVRNFCAHHERLWDRELATKFQIPRKMGIFPDPGAFFNKAEPGKLYNTLVMLAYLTREITNSTAWTRSLASLMNQYPNIPQTAMGFGPDWQDLSIWQE